ncbi:hypothetical protein CEQ90_06545 [Lewinellaceae bacterium SD302]|nr:hypothetical protein CEQ90_06545 [Lewinellaceae bacterium SD302]
MLKRIINKIRREYRRMTTPPRHKLATNPDYWFNRCYAGGDASVVQIGSNDGKTGDPLHALLLCQPKWEALFVEPIPYIFAKLKANYPQESRFRFANVAINDGSRMPFYYVTGAAKEAYPELPYWYDQLGSFNRDHLTTHLDGKLTPFVETMEVEGITLPGLLHQTTVTSIDILHIDCEGYDWKVLSQLDLKKYRPGLILFEFHHLSDEELMAAKGFLANHYRIYRLGIDYLAFSLKLDEQLLAEADQKLKRVKLEFPNE